jgi:hypothetical protein
VRGKQFNLNIMSNFKLVLVPGTEATEDIAVRLGLSNEKVEEIEKSIEALFIEHIKAGTYKSLTSIDFAVAAISVTTNTNEVYAASIASVASARAAFQQMDVIDLMYLAGENTSRSKEVITEEIVATILENGVQERKRRQEFQAELAAKAELAKISTIASV